jgi:hypothetical protein
MLKSNLWAGILTTFFLVLAGCQTTSTKHVADKSPHLVSAKKIWDFAGHNAFTDLIRFHGQWYCTFRESEGHVQGNGRIRVIVSKDGNHWKSAALLVEAGVDLRDPKLSIMPDHRLMLVFGGTIHEGTKIIERQPRVAFSYDGSNWTAPERALEKGDWLWRVTWNGGRAYGIVYQALISNYSNKGPEEWDARFVESDDGVHYRTVSDFKIPNRPNEATARFLKNGDCVILIRREAGDKQAWIGISSAPFTGWKWKPAGMFIGGPDFIVLDDGSLIAGGREVHPSPAGAGTFIGKMDLNSVTPIITLPGNGNWDCGYPGMVWHEGELWVSYYSSQDGKASIYLAKIKFD